MAISRGKKFEEIIKEQISNLPDYTIERLYDVTSGRFNIKTPSDFIVYKMPYMCYLECKTLLGNTISFKEISQLDALMERKEHNSEVKAGILIWWIDHQLTVWINAQYAYRLREEGDKSININKLVLYEKGEWFILPGEYKRIYGKYDFDNFLEKMR